jgi:hypothetical protein
MLHFQLKEEEVLKLQIKTPALWVCFVLLVAVLK